MPEVRADAIGMAGQAAVRQDSDAGTRASGSYKGAEVQVVDQQSLVTDALEELTSEFSEDIEKDVSDREVEDGKKADSMERLAQLREVNELLESQGDLKKKDLFRGLKALLERQGAPASEIRQRAAREFQEPAHQYALLKSYAEALKERGAPDSEVAAAEAALEQFMEESGTAVRAALNIGETTNEFVKNDLGDHQTLRDAYRSNVHDYQDMVSVLDDLVERFGEDDLAKSIAFMTQALGADLDAGGPSIDRTKLNLIVNDMHRLESLTTILGNCDIVVDKAQAHGGDPDFTAVSLLRELVPLQESKWVRSDEIKAIPQHAGLEELEPQINFLNDLKDVVRMIPLKSFTRDENRGKLLDAVQQALDETIAIEEEAEEDA